MRLSTPSRPPAQDAADTRADVVLSERAPETSSPEVPPDPPAVLLATALTSGLALIVLVGAAPNNAVGIAARGVILLLFWLVAPGAVVLTPLRRLSPATRVAIAPLIGLTILIATATVGSWTGAWIPRLSATVVAGSALGWATVGLVQTPPGRWLASRRRPTPSSVVLTLGLLVAVGLWVASLPGIRSAPSSVLGLLVAGPPTFPAAILATTIVLLLALRGHHDYLAASAVLALVVVLRATASVVSPLPTAAWTYKHLGVVLALQAHHHVAAGTDIYMHWPGLFAAAAYLCDTSGIAVIDLARWFPPLVHVLLALSTFALARVLGAGRTGAIAASGLIVGLNWVGQDYFSPQAVAVCLAVGVVVLLVQAREHRVSGVLALVLFAAIVVTHQLTPFWLLAVVFLLFVLRRTPWWAALGMAALVAVYLGTRWDVAQAYGLFSGFDPVANAASSVPLVPTLGRQAGALFAKSSSLLMWGATAGVLAVRALRLGLGQFWRFWRHSDVYVQGAIAFSPVLLLFGNSYGGEAILRVTLYSTPGCCAVLGPAVAAALRRGWLRPLVATVWALVTVASCAQSTYSLWSVNLIRPEDVAAAQWLATEHPNGVVIPVIAVWPGRTSVNYERFIGAFTALEPGLDERIHTMSRFLPYAHTPLNVNLAAEVAEIYPRQTTYVVFTRTMRDYDQYYSDFVSGNFDSALHDFAHSNQWEVVRHQNDVWVFRYRHPVVPNG